MEYAFKNISIRSSEILIGTFYCVATMKSFENLVASNQEIEPRKWCHHIMINYSCLSHVKVLEDR